MSECVPEERHVPVLRQQVLAFLQPKAGQTIVDATVGLGGHAAELVSSLGPEGRLIAIDQDPASLEIARQRLVGCPVEWVEGNFRDVASILSRLHVGPVDGLLADLGVSSPQLDSAERGFSFRLEGPLDMRMDPKSAEPAGRLLERLPARQLARIFRDFGEERAGLRIAQRIVEERRRRPLTTTTQLAELVRAVVGPSPARSGKGDTGRPMIDPATRVFQALRIAVNDELGALEALLKQLPKCVRPGGRVVVISFHSLEDRRVKRAFANREYWEPLTRKPLSAESEEVARNPRARSAKLRAAQRK